MNDPYLKNNNTNPCTLRNKFMIIIHVKTGVSNISGRSNALINSLKLQYIKF
jgi:hypothetical protein